MKHSWKAEKGKKLLKLRKLIDERLETASRAIDESEKMDSQSRFFYMGKECAFSEIKKAVQDLIGN